MANEIAKLYASLQYKVDYKGLKKFEATLKSLQEQIDSNKGLEGAFERSRKSASRFHQEVTRGTRQLRMVTADYQRNIERIQQARKAGLVTEAEANQLEMRNLRAIDDLRESNYRREMRRRARMSPRRIASGAGNAAIAGAVVGYGAYQSNEAFQNFAALQASFTMLEGSVKEGGERLKDIFQLAQEYGQDFVRISDSYKMFANSLRGTALEGSTRQMFESITAYTTALGMSNMDAQGTMRAIYQIAAQGKVQGDELEQLAERGIGKNLLAEAMGMSVEEMMAIQRSTEGLKSADILPALTDLMWRLANRGGALEQRQQSTRAEKNRLVNVGGQVNVLMNQMGLDLYMRRVYEGMTEGLIKAAPFFEEVGEFFGWMADSARETMDSLGNFFGSIGNLLDSFDGIAGKLDEHTGGEGLFPSLADLLDNMSGWIDMISNMVNTLRSDKEWVDKILGVGELFADRFIDTIENFLNFFIDRLNMLLPESLELPNADLRAVGNAGMEAATSLGNAAKDSLSNIDQKNYYPGILGQSASSLTNAGQKIDIGNISIIVDGSSAPEEVADMVMGRFYDTIRDTAFVNPITER